MKAINELISEEKARLIVDLFPEMKPVILDKIEAVANYTIENEPEMREKWKNPLISYNEWRTLAKEILKVLTLPRNKRNMLAYNKQFCYLLFLGYRGFFTIDCLIRVACSQEQNKSFNLIVHALFSVEEAYDLTITEGYGY